MNKKSLLMSLPLVVFALAACSPTGVSSDSVGTDDLKWVTPTGAPTLAFYDQGANANWVSSSSPSETVVPAFGTNAFDAIVFDGVSGLNVIAKNNYNYKLAQWVSGGNFYVVSTKHTAQDSFVSGQTIEGFVKTGNASQSFVKLSKDRWGWNYEDTDVTWMAGVSQVKDTLVSNPSAYDYYIVAEPILTAASSALKAKSITLNTIYNLQTEWKAAYEQETIPAAALFVNTSSYAIKKDAIDLFLKETQHRQDVAVAEPGTVVASLQAFGDDTATNTRFGFTSSLVNALQTNNRFGILKTGDIADKKAFANVYESLLGGNAFSDSLFLS